MQTRKSFFYVRYNRLWLLHKIALETRLIQGLLIIQSKMISSRGSKEGIFNPPHPLIFCKYLNPIVIRDSAFLLILAPPIFQTLHRHWNKGIAQWCVRAELARAIARAEGFSARLGSTRGLFSFSSKSIIGQKCTKILISFFWISILVE